MKEFFCNVCKNTGSAHDDGQMDCIAPGCTAAQDRTAFNKWLLREGYGHCGIKEWGIYRHAVHIAVESCSMLLDENERLRNTIAGMQSRTGGLLVEKAEAAAPAAAVPVMTPGKAVRDWDSMVDAVHAPQQHAQAAQPAQISEERTNANAFKAFHRMLCERFGYLHDDVDWRRDLVSLIEYIAKKIPSSSLGDADNLGRFQKWMSDQGESAVYAGDGRFEGIVSNKMYEAWCAANDSRVTGNAHAVLSDEQIERIAELHFYSAYAATMDIRLHRFARAVLAASQQPAAAPLGAADPRLYEGIKVEPAQGHGYAAAAPSAPPVELKIGDKVLALDSCKFNGESFAGDTGVITGFEQDGCGEYTVDFQKNGSTLCMRRDLEFVAVAAPPTPPQEAAARDERAAFESEAAVRGYDLRRTTSGCYADDHLQDAWRMHRAALAATAAQVAVPVEDCRRYCQREADQTSGDVVKQAVDRFLGWKLPMTFGPDNGIDFHRPDHLQFWPIGTNLFTADQAKEMFEHCLAAAPSPAQPAPGADAAQGGYPTLPETHYNGCGDGSEPLYTPEMMRDFYQQGRASGIEEVVALLVKQREIPGIIGDSVIRALNKQEPTA